MAFWRAVFRRSARFTCGFSGAAGGSSFSRDVAHCGKRTRFSRKSPKMAGWQHELHVLDSRAAPFLKTGRLANPVRLFGHP